MVQPALRAASKTRRELLSIFVAAMTSLTASCSLPPGVVNSFWYSIKTTAVSLGSSCLLLLLIADSDDDDDDDDEAQEEEAESPPDIMTSYTLP
jgi:hypothetical protein